MKNTLFRFATLRAPGLLDDADKAIDFVQHPNPQNLGHFKNLVLSKDEPAANQQAQWKTLANTFTPWQEVSEAKDFAGSSFVLFASWLANNATAVGNHADAPQPPAGIPTALSVTEKVVV